MVTDEQRLMVVREIWVECMAGMRWVPLYVALQRYEQRVRERSQ